GLVVVEDGNRERLPELLFDVKAVGRADVLEVDTTDGGLEQLAESYDVVGAFGSHFQVEYVDVGEGLEQDALALHDRLPGQGPDVPEAEHGRAVGHHRHQVALRGVGVRLLRPSRDLAAGLGHPGGVGQ